MGPLIHCRSSREMLQFIAEQRKWLKSVARGRRRKKPQNETFLSSRAVQTLVERQRNVCLACYRDDSKLFQRELNETISVQGAHSSTTWRDLSCAFPTQFVRFTETTLRDAIPPPTLSPRNAKCSCCCCRNKYCEIFLFPILALEIYFLIFAEAEWLREGKCERHTKGWKGAKRKQKARRWKFCSAHPIRPHFFFFLSLRLLFALSRLCENVSYRSRMCDKGQCESILLWLSKINRI